jgi:NodT family efflux transporter outer membrane factor (OMF) lipoprotein
VARNYLELRGYQQRILIARENIETQRATVELTRARLQAGIDSDLKLAQAQAQLSATEAQLPALERAMTQSMHRLAVLLGQPPGALLATLTPTAAIPTLPPAIPIGLPSELLRRRPDVRRAERELAAASARVGVATAELFPKFSLSGGFGRQGLELADMTDPGSAFWSIGPALRWPVFDAGRIRAAIDVRDARQESALARYEQTVLIALEDVENAMVAYANEERSHRSLVAAVEASRRALEIANALYQRGLVNFLNILEGQRALYLSQDALVQNQQRGATSVVALYKALGGGWEHGDEPQRSNGETR